MALVQRWRLRISSHQILAGQIAPISSLAPVVEVVMLQAKAQPRRSKRLATQPKPIYKEQLQTIIFFTIQY